MSASPYDDALSAIREHAENLATWLASLTARPPFRPEARLAQGGRWHKFTRFG